MTDLVGAFDQLTMDEEDDDKFRSKEHIKQKGKIIETFCQSIIMFQAELRDEATTALEKSAVRFIAAAMNRAQTDLNNDRDTEAAINLMKAAKEALQYVSSKRAPAVDEQLAVATETIASWGETSSTKHLDIAVHAFNDAPNDYSKLEDLAKAHNGNQTNTPLNIQQLLIAVWPKALRLCAKSAVSGVDVEAGLVFMTAALKDPMVSANLGAKLASDDLKSVMKGVNFKKTFLRFRDDLDQATKKGEKNGGSAFDECLERWEAWQKHIDDLPMMTSQPGKDCASEYKVLVEAATSVRNDLGKDLLVDVGRVRVKTAKDALNAHKALIARVSGGSTGGKKWHDSFSTQKFKDQAAKLVWLKALSCNFSNVGAGAHGFTRERSGREWTNLSR
jgi:hypothetical protein